MTARIEYAMPAADYFAVEALSASQCKTLLVSPERWAWERSHPHEPTPAMRFGSLVHCCTLEPGEVEARYAVRPPGIARRTKEGKSAWETFEAQAAGREIIDEDDAARADACRCAVLDEISRVGEFDLLHREVSLFWQRGTSAMKARLDALLHCGALDLKTTSGELDDASLQRAIWQYRYDLQAAHYLDGLAACGIESAGRFVFAFVTTAPPHRCRLIELSHEALTAGLEARNQAATIYQGALVFGGLDSWRGKVSVLDQPPWARNKGAFDE